VTRESTRIAYLATAYPFVSHTFIQGEVIGLPDYGIGVLPIALNPPADGDLLSELDAAEVARTFYVKGVAPLAVAMTVASTAVRHPIAFAAGSLRALAYGGLNPTIGIKAVAQFVEALLVWQHCKRNGVSAIHAHFGQAPCTVAMFAARFGTATGRHPWTWSVTIHGWHEFVNEDEVRLKSKIAAADLVVCVSDFTRAQLMRIAAPTDWSKIHVVRCGIDLGAFAFQPARPVDGRRRIAIIARLSPEKGHVVLFEAVARLRDASVDVDVVVVGDGPSAADLREAAAHFGVTTQVEFAGALPPAGVATALAGAHVFCLPTFAEGLPVSIMEAMAVGVPVVTTYISGIPELVVNGATGWIVPAGSVDDLVAALESALSSPDRAAVVAAARAAVESHHDRTKTIAELADLLARTHRLERS
jgi:colanic acid/amylovoran biosynthesis glycosyltransferase